MLPIPSAIADSTAAPLEISLEEMTFQFSLSTCWSINDLGGGFCSLALTSRHPDELVLSTSVTTMNSHPRATKLFTKSSSDGCADAEKAQANPALAGLSACSRDTPRGYNNSAPNPFPPPGKATLLPCRISPLGYSMAVCTSHHLCPQEPGELMEGREPSLGYWVFLQ